MGDEPPPAAASGRFTGSPIHWSGRLFKSEECKKNHGIEVQDLPVPKGATFDPFNGTGKVRTLTMDGKARNLPL